MDRHAPVGVFDSGSGGISVLREAVRLLPREDFIYYGDSKNAPYGTKSKDEVLHLAQNAADFLLNRGAKAIVIACNTATACAARELRSMLSVPIIGMEPALKPASMLRKNGIVLVMATPGTLESEKYADLYERYGQNAVSLPCPGLMEFAEKGDLSSPALHDYLNALLLPYAGQTVDAAVLGCTHYVFLKRAIAAHFSSHTRVIDGNEGTVRQLIRRLEECDLLENSEKKGEISFFSSGNENNLAVFRNLFEIIT